jgi:outer membrane lipoprotein-sorting protein
MKKFLIILTLFGLGSSLLQAQGSEKAAKIIKQSQQKLETIQDFSADFTYSITNPNMKKPVVRAGELKYKGGKFVIQMPDQEVYCDGVTQWVYLPDPEAPEVTIMDYDPEEPWIEAIFKVYEASTEPRYDGTEKVHGVNCHKIFLAIKDPNLDFNQAYVWINTSNNFLEKTMLIDRRQTQNIYEFSNVKTDQGLSNLDFRFDVSKYNGIDVFDER